MNKEFAISEFQRLILTNHTVNEESQLLDILNIIYDKGFERGKLKEFFGSSNYYHIKRVKEFDIDKFLKDSIEKLNVQRISNIRDLRYNGHEITSCSILASDFEINESLEYMNSDDEYCGFKSEYGEKESYEESLRNAYDDDETENAHFTYHKQEVYILLLKCYQLGFSDGTQSTEYKGNSIYDIYNLQKQVDNYRNSIDDSQFVEYDGKKLQVNGIANDDDLKSTIDMIDILKRRCPDWESYQEYFI